MNGIHAVEDSKLATSAQRYHFAYQKRQMLSRTPSGNGDPYKSSDLKDDAKDTIYAYPGPGSRPRKTLQPWTCTTEQVMMKAQKTFSSQGLLVPEVGGPVSWTRPNNTTFTERKTLHHSEWWIVSAMFSDYQFIQKHLPLLLLFKDENHVVCMFKIDRVFIRSYLNTRVLKIS
ncbi:hypothetical protein CLF_113249 [Clonorchis sinensis]|uniref:Uncharacterized protein n=1 Tax=Clonorchis sinensis TaxID=79923 RepID=G7YY00_CLOSI|nr:hypothetical protein CLF_113249 [Clonorchis sinensis]